MQVQMIMSLSLLQILMHRGEMEHRELLRSLSVTSPTLTNVVDVLERKGHVIRVSNEVDGRVKSIRMTDSARSVCYSKEFCDAGDALVENMFDGFNAEERKQFLAMLARIERNLDDIK